MKVLKQTPACLQVSFQAERQRTLTLGLLMLVILGLLGLLMLCETSARLTCSPTIASTCQMELLHPLTGVYQVVPVGQVSGAAVHRRSSGRRSRYRVMLSTATGSHPFGPTRMRTGPSQALVTQVETYVASGQDVVLTSRPDWLEQGFWVMLGIVLMGALAESMISQTPYGCTVEQRRPGKLAIHRRNWLGQATQQVFSLWEVETAEVVKKRGSKGHHYWATRIVFRDHSVVEFASYEPRHQQQQMAEAINRLVAQAHQLRW